MEILQYWFEAIILGLSLSLLIGPIFVAQFSGVTHDGLKGGFMVCFGIWLSDLLFIIFSYIVLQNFKDAHLSSQTYQLIGWAGGVLLLILGLRNIFKTGTPKLVKESNIHLKYSKHFTKGFLINTINPFTILFWMATGGLYVLTKQVGMGIYTLVFGTILCCIILTDSIKVILLSRINNKTIEDNILIINRVSGFALVLFGIVLFIRSQSF